MTTTATMDDIIVRCEACGWDINLSKAFRCAVCRETICLECFTCGCSKEDKKNINWSDVIRSIEENVTTTPEEII